MVELSDTIRLRKTQHTYIFIGRVGIYSYRKATIQKTINIFPHHLLNHLVNSPLSLSYLLYFPYLTPTIHVAGCLYLLCPHFTNHSIFPSLPERKLD